MDAKDAGSSQVGDKKDNTGFLNIVKMLINRVDDREKATLG